MRRRNSGRDIHGILLLDKAGGISSNQALQQVKRLFNARKAGHTGSLDQLATGLLPVCFGEATKISTYMLAADKKYESVFRLGCTTETGDAEGDVLQQRPFENITKQQIEKVLQSFVGKQNQVPPMYSALKRQGRPLYQLARQGKSVERQARTIYIYALQLIHFDGADLRVSVHCSKGTYIRSLAEDVGEALGCGAHVSELRRTAVGEFEDMLSREALSKLAVQGTEVLDSVLLPMDRALCNWPSVYVSAEAAYYLRRGQSVQIVGSPLSGQVKLMDRQSGILLALGEVQDNGLVAPKKVFQYSQACQV